MLTRITVSPRDGHQNAAALALVKKAKKWGYPIEKALLSSVTLLETNNENDAKRIAEELLCDPISERFEIGAPETKESWTHCHVFPLPGVTNPVVQSLEKAIEDMGQTLSNSPRVGQLVAIQGLAENQVENFTADLLYNSAVEQCLIDITEDKALPSSPSKEFELKTVALIEADDATLLEISKKGILALNLDEMTTIQKHFKDLGRDPTDIELESLAQTWSEHCCHKTLGANVKVGDRVINNVLKSTIFDSTIELNKDWCVSIFKDNAGVIAFDDEDGISFKVETHNHPSAIEPYGGAGTGLGGCIRDTLGTGCSARPIANTDVFCFAPLDMQDLPKGVLPPERVMEQVVAGIRDYGNRMGIPTVNGAICYDPDYVGNPLVFAGSMGIIPLKYVEKETKRGDLIVAIGGRTGRDGIHGATFSSVELTEDSQEVSSGAVQIGNPIMEKMFMEVLLQARDQDLLSSVTDCGAGGFSSAIGEMGEKVGAEVNLEDCPLKYSGLTYWEIWISESQERMVISLPPEHLETFTKICANENVESVVLGTFGTENNELILKWQGQIVGQISMAFLHDGRPTPTREAIVPEVIRQRGPAPEGDALEILEKIMASPNVASKEWVIRQYDHEVQAGSIIKPLVGVKNDGPSDAAVIAPKFGSNKGVVLANGINPHYGKIDSYAMTVACVDEALRNVIAVGGSIERCALLDNFSWGNTKEPEGLGSILRSAEACRDAALGFETPFVSGKDSLNNEFTTEGKTIVIPNTILISAYSIMEDVRKALSMDLKAAGNRLYLVGSTGWELGGSHLKLVCGQSDDSTVPLTDIATNKALYESLAEASHKRLIRSAHDLSEGGLAVTLTEMAFAGEIGVKIDLAKVICQAGEKLPDLVTLFSESTGRLLLEIEADKAEAFEEVLKGQHVACIGETVAGEDILVENQGTKVLKARALDLKEIWQRPLDLERDPS
jgi:phosphoribosylformylglycinamidine synthase II